MENKDRGYPNYTALRISVVSLKSEKQNVALHWFKQQ